MVKLDSDTAMPDFAAEIDHPPHRRFVFLTIEAGTSVGDTSFWLNPGCFYDYQGRPSHGDLSKMGKVPVCHAAIYR